MFCITAIAGLTHVEMQCRDHMQRIENRRLEAAVG